MLHEKTTIKNNPEKLINTMGLSEFLSGKKRNITDWNVKNGTVSQKYMNRINELNDLVENWMEGVVKNGL